MATHPPTGTLLVALDQIHVPVNVRELDQAHVDALAGSIALQGMLVPVVLTHAESPATAFHAGRWLSPRRGRPPAQAERDPGGDPRHRAASRRSRRRKHNSDSLSTPTNRPSQ